MGPAYHDGGPMSLGVPGKSPLIHGIHDHLGDPCKVSGKEGTFGCGTSPVDGEAVTGFVSQSLGG